MHSDHPLEDFYSDIYSSYDQVNRLFTFGRDRHWRKKAVEAMLEKDSRDVLDVCTGTGDLILELADEALQHGKSEEMRFRGFDMTEGMLEVARKKLHVRREQHAGSAEPAFPEVEFIRGEVSQMPFGDSTFDAMGISFGIRNLLFENSQAGLHLNELHRVLKPGGLFVIVESSKPGNRVWRLFHNIYLRFILPWLGGLVSGNFKAYRYLARSSRNYYTAPQMVAILEEAGFKKHSMRSLFLGSVMLVVVRK